MKKSSNEAEEKTNSWLSETCCRWVSDVIHARTIFILEPSLTWEWKFAMMKSTWELKFSGFILSVPIAMLMLLSRQIPKTMTMLCKRVEHVIMNQSKMLNRQKNYWKKWKSMKKMVIQWSTWKIKLMTQKEKCS